MNIALALSGGGYRATVFHLGALARLAREDQLKNVTHLSTVSGGSLCAGMVLAANAFQWPSSEQYLTRVLPEAKRLLTSYDMQVSLVKRVLSRISTLWESRADDLSDLIQEKWGVTANLSELPESPRWMINTTCYETGKDWRFERFRMGDYVFGYTNDTGKVKVADAMAASSGFPGPIGPLPLVTTPYHWYKYDEADSPAHDYQPLPAIQKRQTHAITPAFPKVHLWDGGVYDNHGLEGLHDFKNGWKDKFEFLIVSDAAGRPNETVKYSPGVPALLRMMTGIMMNQVRSLRTRAVVERMDNHDDKGVIFQTGNTCQYVLRRAGQVERIPEFCANALTKQQADGIAAFPTAISKLKPEDYDLIFQHGFEVADVTLCAYYPDEFKHVAFS
jgi:NTE family protein